MDTEGDREREKPFISSLLKAAQNTVDLCREEKDSIDKIREDSDNMSAAIQPLRHLFFHSYSCLKCNKCYRLFSWGSLVHLNLETEEETMRAPERLQEMINRTLQKGEEPSRRCINISCTGSILSRKHFVEGFDQVMFSIDRIRWVSFAERRKNMDTARVERSFEIPLVKLMMAGNSYSLILVVYQVASVESNGRIDSRNGHVFVHKRVKHKDGVTYWVLLDDEKIEVVREREFEEYLEDRGGDVSALVYKKEDIYSESNEESSNEM